ncbi:MAG: M20/M25/M40 family metallo-hydrolase [Gemmatimonadota bacterium]|nr:M20/M25/M40 family metallo-hydrolase [Gemmatimonadota bacterium]
MRRSLLTLLLAPALAGAQQTGTPATTPRAATVARPAAVTAAQRMDRAWFAWEAGGYEAALADFQHLLEAPEADRYHDRIAELTGEVWRTTEVAKDARAPRWSPDGRHLSYEWGPPAERHVRVVRAEAGFPAVREFDGVSPVFAPDGRSIAWLASASDGKPVLHWAPLAGGAVTEYPVDAAAAGALTLLGDGPLRAAVLTRGAGAAGTTLQVRDLTPTGAWATIPITDGQPLSLTRSTNGARAIVLLGAARAAGAAAAPRGPGGAGRSDAFAVLGDGALGDRIAGTAPVLSDDGSTIAWLAADSRGTAIMVRAGAAATMVHLSETPVQGLALSPDGARLAWQTMLREDWELFTAPGTGAEPPTRLTREIQHDLFPQFLTSGRVLAVIGEARHRRSHLYDLATGTRTRLFHNNSVRTVAPEYEWAPSPDGSRVAIVSERDGDTVTPHRNLYLTDLTAKVPRAVLVARLDSNLAAERARRIEGARIFAPIAPAVRTAVEEVDVNRIYATEKDLFAFDSKHVTQPGNWKATEYLLAKYRGYGLDAHLQRFTTSVGGRDIPVANVVAVIPGTVNPELIYVVGAHFDSRAEGPGADDNTSGTAMILEAARVLAARPQPATVMFVSFTGEEAGLRGAREFGRRMKDSIHVVGALNNDMMGWANDQRMDNTIRYSNPGIRDVQHAAAMQFSRLITYDAFYYKSTDAQALYDAWGDIVGGIGSYPILGNPHYHMPHDVLETINHQQLAETSRTTVATIMLLAASPSRLNGLTAAGTQATWTPSPEQGVTRYLVRWGPPADPMRFSATVATPRATLAGARPGWMVAVKAVNAAGLEGWDWARADVK